MAPSFALKYHARTFSICQSWSEVIRFEYGGKLHKFSELNQNQDRLNNPSIKFRIRDTSLRFFSILRKGLESGQYCFISHDSWQMGLVHHFKAMWTAFEHPAFQSHFQCLTSPQQVRYRSCRLLQCLQREGVSRIRQQDLWLRRKRNFQMDGIMTVCIQ